MSNNPRSTVGTVTEIQDYLRLLFANIGTLHCPKSGKPVRKQSAQEMFNTTINWQQDEPLLIFAPLISKQKGEFHTLFADLQRQGFVRVRVDGEIMRLEDCGRLEKYKQHTIELVIDRVTNSKENHPRLLKPLNWQLDKPMDWFESNMLKQKRQKYTPRTLYQTTINSPSQN